MNMDELKLIAETIGKLGEAGQSAFGWWLLADKVLPSICWLVILLAICFTAYRIFKARTDASTAPLTALQKANEAVRHAWLYCGGRHDATLYEMHKRLEELVKRH